MVIVTFGDGGERSVGEGLGCGQVRQSEFESRWSFNLYSVTLC